MRTFKKVSVLICMILAGFTSSFSQSIIVSTEGDSAVVIGGDYAAKSFYNTFFGEHYRSAWLAKIKVPYIDLKKEQLTPLKQQYRYPQTRTGSGWRRRAKVTRYHCRSDHHSSAAG